MENEFKIPDIFKNKFDYKSNTLFSFEESLKIIKSGQIDDVSIDPNTQLILFTNIGRVSGTITNITLDKSKDPSDKFTHCLLNVRNMHFNDYLKNIPEPTIVNNSSLVIVKDAVLSPYDNPNCVSNIKQLFLFSDQIVGFSYGTLTID